MTLHPAIALGVLTPVALNIWRFMPSQELALIAFAWAFVALALLLHRVKPGTPDGLVSAVVAPAIVATACALAGDAVLARIAFGGCILALLLAVYAVADDALWWAYFGAGGTEFLAWLLGNANRGTFGVDVAYSAIGQAFGPWAQPAQWAAIIALYAWACYNHRANTHV